MDDIPDLPETATGDASQTSSNTAENALAPQSASARTQSPFAVLAQAMRLMSTNAELLDPQEESKKLAIALHQQLQDSWPELKSLHLPAPESLDDWTKLALIAGIPRVEMETLSANDIYISALAWAERIKIKSKLLQDVRSDGDGEPEKSTDNRSRESDQRIATECHVTLRQMAAIVNKSKRTLERLYQNGKLPAPAVEGGKGKAYEWRWSDIKPILETQYDRQLPKTFPSDQFIRR